MQNYLKTIYRLQERDGVVSTSSLAIAMSVAAPSATGMMKKLVRYRTVRYTRYQGVVLTKTGRQIALEVIRHHRLLELYLAASLGYSWDAVHEEAERLEHVISEDFEERVFEALGRPTRDPHGEPIPTREGALPVWNHDSLADLEPGASGTIRQVRDSSPDMLRYLGARGLVPDAVIRVVDKAPFNGPLTVNVGASTHALGRDLARHIRVEMRPMLGEQE
ncbi:MAG: metal-dependent transcriptional regulator [candidate division NC10 bacterium]|nr:metal-dependent transcriptional regulator [candidate division NC10 bacterium]